MEPNRADAPHSASPHLSEDTLEKYFLRTLSETEYEEVETHLMICSACQDQAERVEGFVKAMKVELAKPVPPAPGPWMQVRSRAPMLAGGFAVLALAASVAYFRTPAGDPAEITLRAERGGGDAAAHGQAGVPMILHLASESFTPDASHQVRIVDAGGSAVWNGQGGASIHVEKPLGAGAYWVRVYGADQQLVREYGLLLE